VHKIDFIRTEIESDTLREKRTYMPFWELVHSDCWVHFGDACCFPRAMLLPNPKFCDFQVILFVF